MKRALLVMIALLVTLAFAGGAIAQAPAKTEKPAAAAPAPAPEKAAKPEKAPAKPKEAKAMKFSGTVSGYEAGKMLKVKGAKDKEMAFDLTGDTKMKGDVKEGAKVTVMYKKEGDKMVANSVSVAPPPKKAAPKEKEGKKS